MAITRGGAGGPDAGSGPRRAFASLAVPNFRLYAAGQSISLPGTWMQVVAQSWLVPQLSGSEGSGMSGQGSPARRRLVRLPGRVYDPLDRSGLQPQPRPRRQKPPGGTVAGG